MIGVYAWSSCMQEYAHALSTYSSVEASGIDMGARIIVHRDTATRTSIRTAEAQRTKQHTTHRHASTIYRIRTTYGGSDVLRDRLRPHMHVQIFDRAQGGRHVRVLRQRLVQVADVGLHSSWKGK